MSDSARFHQTVYTATSRPAAEYPNRSRWHDRSPSAYNAIHVRNGVAVVDADSCVGCGACAKMCPKGLIELIPADKKVAVACSNQDKGPEVKKVCTAGCIGCRLCVKQCEFEAITVDGFLAHVDYDKCTGCGKCAEKCPSKIITWLDND